MTRLRITRPNLSPIHFARHFTRRFAPRFAHRLAVPHLGAFALAAAVLLPFAGPAGAQTGPAPVAVAAVDGPTRYTSASMITLDGSGSTGNQLTYSWQLPSTTPGQLFDTVEGARITFQGPVRNFDSSSTLRLFLTVTDADGRTDMDSVDVMLFGPPQAQAGNDRTVASGEEVTLMGTGRAGTQFTNPPLTFTYDWERIGGTAPDDVTLNDRTARRPTFTTLGGGTHIFRLTVTDELGGEDTDEVTITVEAPLEADAGEDRFVPSGEEAMLMGGASGGVAPYTYQWSQTGGPTVALLNANTATARFTPPAITGIGSAVSYTFQLTVADTEPNTGDIDQVVITAVPRPRAFAGGNQNVASGATVTLLGDGSSAPEISPTVDYSWARVGGTSTRTPALTNRSGSFNWGVTEGAIPETTTFTADTLAPGTDPVTHIIELTITDELGTTATSQAIITVFPPGPPPADAGEDRMVDSGARVVLRSPGASSGDGYTYSWTRVSGIGGMWTDPTRGPTAVFVAPTLAAGAEPVSFPFRLTVTSPGGGTATDEVTVTVGPPAQIASRIQVRPAGVVRSGTTVTLDGLTSRGAINSYAWTRVSGPSVSLTNANQEIATFVAPLVTSRQTLRIRLEVREPSTGGSRGHSSTVDIMIDPPNDPMADAGPDQSVESGSLVRLDGSRSSSPDSPDGIVSYSWARTGGTGDASVTLSDPMIVNPTFTAEELEPEDEEVTHIFTLTVTDGHNLTGTDEVTITVEPPPPVDPIRAPIGEFMEMRNKVLLANQPDLVRLMRSAAFGGNLNLDITGDGVDGDGQFFRGNFWGEVTGSQIADDGAEGNYLFMAYGMHRRISETFFAGGMVQYDSLDETLDGELGAIDGSGWLIGPYFVVKHPGRPLYLSGGALYGQTSNDVVFQDERRGRRAGSFTTTRTVATLGLTGEWALDEGSVSLFPYARGGFVNDEADDFTDDLGIEVDGQSVSTAQLDAGLKFEIPIDFRGGRFALRGGKGLILAHTDGDAVENDGEARSKAELGFSWELNGGLALTWQGFYDGLYTSDFENWGSTVNVEKRF